MMTRTIALPVGREGGEGMTLRDYFAAKAMHSLMDEWTRNIDSFSSIEQLAEAAYEYADAMLKERNK